MEVSRQTSHVGGCICIAASKISNSLGIFNHGRITAASEWKLRDQNVNQRGDDQAIA